MTDGARSRRDRRRMKRCREGDDDDCASEDEGESGGGIAARASAPGSCSRACGDSQVRRTRVPDWKRECVHGCADEGCWP
jgi:hypothetical protein